MSQLDNELELTTSVWSKRRSPIHYNSEKTRASSKIVQIETVKVFSFAAVFWGRHETLTIPNDGRE